MYFPWPTPMVHRRGLIDSLVTVRRRKRGGIERPCPSSTSKSDHEADLSVAISDRRRAATHWAKREPKLRALGTEHCGNLLRILAVGIGGRRAIKKKDERKLCEQYDTRQSAERSVTRMAELFPRRR